MSNTCTAKGVGQLTATEQLDQFVSALFREDDLVEIRPIETWTDPGDGRRRSRMLRGNRCWLTPSEIRTIQAELAKINRNQRANIFVGVNPRPRPGVGAKHDIQLCRSVWADLDDITIDQAVGRWRALSLPPPSITVISGHGVHAYWLLTDEYWVRCRADRVAFESMLQVFYREMGSDATSDLSRLLRLPGFLNMKDARVGRTAIPCTLFDCCPSRIYGLDLFSRWMEKASHGSDSELSGSASCAYFGPILVEAFSRGEVKVLVEALDVQVSDRSRRDYGIVCALLRLGLATEEIWQLVADKSKFRTNGRAYFETTAANAVRNVFH